jgi:hypothetical protein
MKMTRLTLFFEDDALTRIDSPMRPDPNRALAAADEREVVVKVPDWQDNRGLINRTLNSLGLERKK